jgi:hypothetical protein
VGRATFGATIARIGTVLATDAGFVALTSAAHPGDDVCAPLLWLSSDGNTWDLVSPDSPFGNVAFVHGTTFVGSPNATVGSSPSASSGAKAGRSRHRMVRATARRRLRRYLRRGNRAGNLGLHPGHRPTAEVAMAVRSGGFVADCVCPPRHVGRSEALGRDGPGAGFGGLAEIGCSSAGSGSLSGSATHN